MSCRCYQCMYWHQRPATSEGRCGKLSSGSNEHDTFWAHIEIDQPLRSDAGVEFVTRSGFGCWAGTGRAATTPEAAK